MNQHISRRDLQSMSTSSLTVIEPISNFTLTVLATRPATTAAGSWSV